MSYFIRPMGMGDIHQVSGIEREAFSPPWPATNFKRELASNSLTYYFVACEEATESKQTPPENVNVGCNTSSRSRLEALRHGLRRLFGVKKPSETPCQFVLGFAGLWFMADEAHLANIAVRESHRNQGIGERLFISAVELAIERKARFITLEVRASNKAAQALYGKYGLVEVGTRRAYYMDNKEDAVIMTADAVTSPAYLYSFQKQKQAHVQRWGLRA